MGRHILLSVRQACTEVYACTRLEGQQNADRKIVIWVYDPEA